MKKGDRVKIREGSEYYGQTDCNNPFCEGTIIQADHLSSSHGFRVEWDNKEKNCYNQKDLILVETMKKEKVKPQTFRINGRYGFLQEMLKDLEKLGYREIQQHLTVTDNAILSNDVHTLSQAMEVISINFTHIRDVVFTLPAQYDEAIEFCKNRIDVVKEYFKPEEPDFKVGQWIYRNEYSEQLGRFQHITSSNILHACEVYVLENDKVEQIHTNTICVGDAPGAWKIATPEQIERVLTIVAKEKGFVEGVTFRGINKETCKLNGMTFTLGCIRYDDDLDALASGGWVYSKGTWAEVVKETFPQIEIAGYKAEFTDKTVNFGCNRIPKETFISLCEMIGNLPGRNELISMDMKYDSYSFNLTCDQIRKIAGYYLKPEKKVLPF
jgi:hypothetical protein